MTGLVGRTELFKEGPRPCHCASVSGRLCSWDLPPLISSVWRPRQGRGDRLVFKGIPCSAGIIAPPRGPAHPGSAPWISRDRSGEWVWGEVAGEGVGEPRPPRLRVSVRENARGAGL